MTGQDISFKGTELYKGLPQLDCQYTSIEINLRSKIYTQNESIAAKAHWRRIELMVLRKEKEKLIQSINHSFNW